MRIRLVIGSVLCLIGVLWLGQGVGLIGGSFMTGEVIWAVIGAIALLFGVALLSGTRRRLDHEPDD
jgi:uncharacterized membrane protein